MKHSDIAREWNDSKKWGSVLEITYLNKDAWYKQK